MISNEIIKHIFQYITSSNEVGLLSPKYLIDKDLAIELEDGEILSKQIRGITGKIGSSVIKILLTDISLEVDEKEYVIIIQLDNLSVYALKYSEFTDTVSKAYFLHNEESWIELSQLLLAKLFVGIEQLKELFIDYQSLTNYQELYQCLISFMNYEENLQNHQ